MFRHLCVAVVVVLAGVLSDWLALGFGDEPKGKLSSAITTKLGEKAVFGADLRQVEAALRAPSEREAWKPKAKDEKSRGVGLFVYPKVAPATVVVRNAFGHGTGFVVDPGGWIVTNRHIIQWADLEPKQGRKS